MKLKCNAVTDVLREAQREAS